MDNGYTYFQYGSRETDYLSRRDPCMARTIATIGHVERRVIPDLFTALVHAIAGQQISSKAHATVWERICRGMGEITPATVMATPLERLQGFGISFRKAGYIRSAAERILSGRFDLGTLGSMTDDEVCARLSELDGVGRWTAEMLMLFSMQRPDILSYQDAGIMKGLRTIHGLDRIGREEFERYRQLYSPYASTASIYLWEAASMAPR